MQNNIKKVYYKYGIFRIIFGFICAILLCGTIYYIYTTRTDEDLNKLSQSANRANKYCGEAQEELRKGRDRLTDATSTAEGLSESNNQLQKSQRRTEESIQTSREQLQSIKDTIEDSERTQSEIDSTIGRIDDNFKRIKELQSERDEYISKAERANSSADKTISRINGTLTDSKREIDEFERRNNITSITDRKLQNEIKEDAKTL